MTNHLGGYVPGGDEATWFPDLWEWAVKEFDVRFVLDIGCGEGHSTRFFKKLGCQADGIDGAMSYPPIILQHDYTKGPYLPHIVYDMVWCCEFLEHVEEKYLPYVVPSFLNARIVMITHAEPGQAGHHHVNCREPEYWKGFFAGIGYTFQPGLTLVARAQAAINPSPWNHFVRSGMVFTQ